ncbi:DUF2026 family protein [Roseibium sp.]|uniref:DUF2026 family protein n=1 Tax=Roseibium sp. TaxID=1936156 RepID=UPI003A97114D
MLCVFRMKLDLIDFITPAFNRIRIVKNSNIRPKMFQKPLGQMPSSLKDLSMEGDFYVESTLEMTAKHMHTIPTRPA